MDINLLADITKNTMDGNIPMYVFALISGVVGLFSIGWALIKYSREGDISLHCKLDQEIKDRHNAEMKMNAEINELKGQISLLLNNK